MDLAADHFLEAVFSAATCFDPFAFGQGGEVGKLGDADVASAGTSEIFADNL